MLLAPLTGVSRQVVDKRMQTLTRQTQIQRAGNDASTVRRHSKLGRGWATALLIASLTAPAVQAQYGQSYLPYEPVTPNATTVRVEIGGYGVNGAQMPFWLRSNQWGAVPLNGSAGTVRAGIWGDYNGGGRPGSTQADSSASGSKFGWSYGLDVVGNSGLNPKVLLPEAYAGIRFGKFELFAGRRRQIVGLCDTLLTSGSYIWSGNALPLPKIQFGTIGYVPIFKGVLAFNASYNHGWFANTDASGRELIVRNSYLHQKTLYVRLGKPTWAFRLYGGVNHQVQWGGYAPSLPAGLANNGDLPSSLRAYQYVVTAQAYPDFIIDPNLSTIDVLNRVGNHLGSIDVGADINIGSFNLLMYRQSLVESGSIFYLTSIIDGLNGIRLRNNQPGDGLLTVDNVLFEFFYSKSQGGPEFVLEDPQRRGKVNYFNHSQYQDGWIYQNHTIGTPFLTPQTDVRPGLQTGRAIVNNRVALWHGGLSGRLAQRVQWQLKLSYSQNLGTYDSPYPANTNQFSGILSAGAPLTLPVLGDCDLSASAAYDQGKLFYNATGFFASLRKTVRMRRAGGQSRGSTGASSPWRIPN
ncbi:capsule assembly protein Wzi [Spirosoma oryzae]|uniref:Capsule assembly protein Wzi n=2 Tax=Spirosoma oryzae TaxID=1469603 RepID=A0A2T0TF11_9BACT|nr:capsule assembly protein Wzi [Spirosoma oryzae]